MSCVSIELQNKKYNKNTHEVHNEAVGALIVLFCATFVHCSVGLLFPINEQYNTKWC